MFVGIPDLSDETKNQAPQAGWYGAYAVSPALPYNLHRPRVRALRHSYSGFRV